MSGDGESDAGVAEDGQHKKNKLRRDREGDVVAVNAAMAAFLAAQPG